MSATPAAAARRMTSVLRVSIESGTRACGPQRLDHRQDAAAFLLGVDGRGAGPRRLAADVEDVGALGLEPQAMVDRGVGVEIAPAVGRSCRA